MRVLETKLFRFEELSIEAQNKALEKNRNIMDSELDFEERIEFSKEVGEVLGFSFGDLSFETYNYLTLCGDYRWKAGAVKVFTKDYGKNEFLISIAQRLAKLQKKYYYKLVSDDITEEVIYIDEYNYDYKECGCEDYFECECKDCYNADIKEFNNIVYNLENYFLSEMNKIDEYYGSDEGIIEYFENFESEFEADGTIY